MIKEIKEILLVIFTTTPQFKFIAMITKKCGNSNILRKGRLQIIFISIRRSKPYIMLTLFNRLQKFIYMINLLNSHFIPLDLIQ